MTQAEKLKALVAHAFERGYVDWWVHHVANPDLTEWIEGDLLYWAYNKGEFAGQPIEDDVPVYSIIFNHDFARALFPGWELSPESAKFIGKEPRPNFHRYVQQAVISKDPISYMYKEVFDDITDGVPEGNDII